MLDDKIKGIEQHFDDLERKLSDPAVISNQREYTALAKERSQMAEVAGSVREYRKVVRRNRRVQVLHGGR